MDRIVHCARECNLKNPTDLVKECLIACDPLLRHYGKEPDVSLPSWAAILIAACLVPLSALFSGLTLGLLSLDPMALKIVAQAGTEHEQRYARRIMPVRARGNLLLCTLLFGNVCVNSAISIVLSDITSGAVGLLLSTVIIVILGEVVPQAVCSRHALFVGAHSIWIVNFFILLFLPVSLPISKMLDWALGRDMGNVFSQEELKRLIDIHVQDPDAQQTSGLTVQDQQLIIGAMSYKHKRVQDVMTPLSDCFMLDAALRLDSATILAIYKSGFTRIPVYQGVCENVIGILYAKDLVLVNPLDELELTTMLSFRGPQVGRIYAHEQLDHVLQHLMSSGSHMLIVHSTQHGTPTDKAHPQVQYNQVQSQPPPPLGAMYYAIQETPVVGLITLEDVLEELMQADIHDETDMMDDNSPPSWHTRSTTTHPTTSLTTITPPRTSGARAARRSRRAHLNHLISLYETRYGCAAGVLTSAEVDAVGAFLTVHHPSLFGHMGQHQHILHQLLEHADVWVCEDASVQDHRLAHVKSGAMLTDTYANGGGVSGESESCSNIQAVLRTSMSYSTSMRNAEGASMSATHTTPLHSTTTSDPWALATQQGWVLYERGQPSVQCTVVLQGKVLVKSGKEGFQLELGPWNVLGQGALERGQIGPYIADFDAVPVAPCRLLRIHRSAYMTAGDSVRHHALTHSASATGYLCGGETGGRGSQRTHHEHPLRPTKTESQSTIFGMFQGAFQQSLQEQPLLQQQPLQEHEARETQLAIFGHSGQSGQTAREAHGQEGQAHTTSLHSEDMDDDTPLLQLS